MAPVLTADTAPKAGKQQKVPPTISAIAAAYTEKGTWFVGLALQADYDGRDNKMTPNRGQFVEFVAWEHLEVLGGETAYWKVGLVADSYHELANEKLVLGLHLDFDTAGGDPPLWGYPWVTMRGIPALRYQNESTAVFATELRWNFASRWAAVGFLGVGGT